MQILLGTAAFALFALSYIGAPHWRCSTTPIGNRIHRLSMALEMDKQLQQGLVDNVRSGSAVRMYARAVNDLVSTEAQRTMGIVRGTLKGLVDGQVGKDRLELVSQQVSEALSEMRARIRDRSERIVSKQADLVRKNNEEFLDQLETVHKSLSTGLKEIQRCV